MVLELGLCLCYFIYHFVGSEQIYFYSFHVKCGCISCPVIPMQKGIQIALLILFPLLHIGEHLLLLPLSEGSFNME